LRGTSNGNRNSEDEDDENDAPHYQQDASENEDLWDFGTVRPVGGRGAGLRPMNDSAANVRASAEPPAMKDKPEPDETVKVTPSPQKSPVKAIFSKLAPSISPTKVPLPASPTKATTNGASASSKDSQFPKTPAALSSSAALSVPPKDSPGSNEYNKAFQAQLAKDMGFLKLDGAAATSEAHSPQTGTPPVQRPKMMIPDIPPFKGNPGKGEPLQKLQAPSKPAGQQALPAFSPKDLPPVPQPQKASMNIQQPLPPLTTPRSQTPTPSMPGTPANQQYNAQENLTALNSVIIPALDAALHRRTYMLRESAKSAAKSPSLGAQEMQQQRAQTHEKVRKLVVKAAGVFNDIQRFDEECPVGMGGGVTEFLEGKFHFVLSHALSDKL
jgi:serine/threonine-protein kinase 24/25/MST4